MHIIHYNLAINRQWFNVFVANNTSFVGSLNLQHIQETLIQCNCQMLSRFFLHLSLPWLLTSK